MVAVVFYKKHWIKTYAILLSAFVIDFDHLLTSPIFDPNRCSINFHPLHSFLAIFLYVCLLVPSKTRLFGIGLCIHIIADTCDCLFL